MYQTFYFFHLVNPANFVQQGKKPVYLEKGPYTFQQKKKKVEVAFSEDGTLVSYVTLVQNEYIPVRSFEPLLKCSFLFLLHTSHLASTTISPFLPSFLPLPLPSPPSIRRNPAATSPSPTP